MFSEDITEIKEIRLMETSWNEGDFTSDELLGVIRSLSPGYRTIFNLFAVEGYKHKEIAEMLEIDINTSKSQFSRARRIIQARLEELSRTRSVNK
jgi:RNA polymerase sigma factor (sigma-70 family)